MDPKQRDNGKIRLLPPYSKPNGEDHFGWILEHLGLLAAAMGKSHEVTPERLQMNAGDLADLSKVSLTRAFTRARRELKYFPQVAELRELAGGGEKQEAATEKLEAHRAWDQLVKHVRRWGVEQLPDYTGSTGRGGKPLYAPQLPPRTQSVLRQMGSYERVAEALEYGNQEHAHWVRDEFTRLYTYACETRDLLAPTREEAKQLLAQVPSWQKALPGSS